MTISEVDGLDTFPFIARRTEARDRRVDGGNGWVKGKERRRIRKVKKGMPKESGGRGVSMVNGREGEERRVKGRGENEGKREKRNVNDE